MPPEPQKFKLVAPPTVGVGDAGVAVVPLGVVGAVVTLAPVGSVVVVAVEAWLSVVWPVEDVAPAAGTWTKEC